MVILVPQQVDQRRFRGDGLPVIIPPLPEGKRMPCGCEPGAVDQGFGRYAADVDTGSPYILSERSTIATLQSCAASSAARVLPALPKPMMTASYCFITFPVLSFPVACGLLRLIVPVMQISGFYAVGEMAALPDVLAIIPVCGLRGVIRPQGTRTAAVRCPCICGKFRFPVRRR